MAAIPPELQKRLESYFAGRPEVEAAFLFGSQARGEAHSASDLDLAVLLAPAAWEGDVPLRSAMLADLMHLCGRPGIDLVVLNDASPLLQHRVLRDGHVIFSRSTRSLAEFTVRAFQRFVDTRPLRELQYRRFLRQLERLEPRSPG